MSRNYRVIRHANGMLALHEVYFDQNGNLAGRTVEAAGFVVNEEDGVEALISMLERALWDARENPTLDASTFRRRPSPSDSDHD
jgi:hypothetical protein